MRVNLQSLEHRRLANDLVMCFKIIHGLVDIDLNDFFTISNNTTLRGHPFKLLVVPIARTNVRKHFFSCRIVNVWNDLPANIVSAPSIMAFRKHLHKLESVADPGGGHRGPGPPKRLTKFFLHTQ